MIKKYKNFNSNKIIKTNNMFEYIKKLDSKDAFVITPLTKIQDLFNFKTTNILMKHITEEYPSLFEKTINEELLIELCNETNKLIKHEVIDIKYDKSKLIKNFISVEDIEINEDIIDWFIKTTDKYSVKIVNIYILGFDKYVSKKVLSHYSNINLYGLVNNLKDLISYNNLETLVIETEDELIELYDKNRFHSYLEQKTRTILSLSDINDYFQGNNTFNSFLIDKALNNI